jgi:hypothetical protein
VTVHPTRLDSETVMNTSLKHKLLRALSKFVLRVIQLGDYAAAGLAARRTP